jgi:hypothetical protein
MVLPQVQVLAQQHTRINLLHDLVYNSLAHKSACIYAMNWACRYLEGGAKVYVFHTLNLNPSPLLPYYCGPQSNRHRHPPCPPDLD